LVLQIFQPPDFLSSTQGFGNQICFRPQALISAASTWWRACERVGYCKAKQFGRIYTGIKKSDFFKRV